MKKILAALLILCPFALVHAEGELDIINAVASAKWTPLGLVALALLVFGYLYNKKIERTATVNKEVVAAQAALEKAETENRKKERDQQIAKLESDLQRKDDKLENALKDNERTIERHLLDHKVADKETKDTMTSIDQRLRIVEINIIPKDKFEDLSHKVNDIEKSVVEAVTILREKLK